ncbi:ABC transporter ATP-binding protein [Dysosmobacter sp.]|jgi:ATP-binding cassette subfamily B multidrug efflux pump|uniref:ABC transporter ATP-binding protein n=1 Tax=Dysosmobacter sp. TaxID=2591382 RepID=UPI003D941F42
MTEQKPKVELRRPSTMGQAVEKPRDTRRTIARLTEYFVQSKGLFLSLMSAVVLVTVTALTSPALQGQVIDTLKDGQWEQFRLLLLWLLLSFALNVAVTLVQGVLAARLSQIIVGRMRCDLFKKLDHLPISYLDGHSSGDLMSRMTNDIENISNTISQSLGSLVSGILTITGTIAIMFWYCWQLTLITLVTVILTVLVTKWMSAKMRQAYRGRAAALGVLNGHGEEMIAGYRSVTAYNRQDLTKEEFNALSDQLTREGIRAEILGGSMGPLMNCISNLGFVIVAAFGGYFALEGLITIGVISAFIIYAKQFSRPLNEIAQLYGSVQTAMAGAERVFALLDQPDEDNSGTKELENIAGHISFRHVDFSYEPGKPILTDFNLEVHSGQKVALVGATGSGKTTVVNLLMRFYPVDAGEICIDGVNIMELRRDWLRHNTAIVLQDTVLFSDTIAANIKYARPDAPESEMERAAELSNCAPFIHRLKEGYQTVLKQAGAGLSHGQRQLLNIARAILADPKILILDEATSSVDTRTEQSIQDALVKLMKNRTSLIIAHRLSTIQDADVIVVMDHGKVVETGNHQQLLNKRGAYYALYMAQFAGNKT